MSGPPKIRDGLDRLRDVICDGDAQRPGWLDAALNRAVAALRYGIGAEAQSPGRVALRNRIEVIREAAESITEALDNGAVMRALAALSPVDDETERQTFHALMDLIARADVTLSGIRLGGGADKYDPNRSPHEICSMLVCTLWRMVRGTKPGHTAAPANEACNILWHLASGDALPDNTNTSRRWLRQIKAANEEIEAHQDADIMRLLGCTER
jgi:hypothetical protein